MLLNPLKLIEYNNNIVFSFTKFIKKNNGFSTGNPVVLTESIMLRTYYTRYTILLVT